MKAWICFLLAFVSASSAQPQATSSPNLAIKVDQVGYRTSGNKIALLVSNGGPSDSHSFTLRRSGDGQAVFQGKWTAPVLDADSQDLVESGDFSSWTQPGQYYLDVPGVGRSWNFAIGDDVYRRAYYLTARGFYGQRCGTAVDLGKEFPAYHHGVCHQTGAYDGSSGKQGEHVSSKGWHDAGDYGRYEVNSGISTATLLWAVELWGSGGMSQISLQIPESGNGTPDLLSEARWNMEWMMTLQDDDGGVWHKQTSAHFCGFIAPEADRLPSLVVGSGVAPFKTSCATADFAAVMAIGARVFRPYDARYADRCLTAARKAWHWVDENPALVFRNPPGITTGEYGDPHCDDERLWAAAELARTTREAAFESFFSQHYRDYLDRITADNPPGYSSMSDFALWTYALGDGQNKLAVQEIQARSLAMADQIAQRTMSSPYRTSLLTKNYVWGSNGVVGNYSLQLLLANRFHADPKYIEAAAGNLDYLLGRNTFSLSFVTQLGSHAVEHIHHRPSADPTLTKPWPGLLSGGPNAGRQDPEMKKRVPADTPPAKCFIDVQGAYAANEIAINWNAPLVFALAGLLDH